VLIYLRIRHLTFSRNVTRKYVALRTCFRTIHFPKNRHISEILTFQKTNSCRQKFQKKKCFSKFCFRKFTFRKTRFQKLAISPCGRLRRRQFVSTQALLSALFWWCNDDSLLKWCVKPSLKERLVASPLEGECKAAAKSSIFPGLKPRHYSFRHELD